MAHLNLRDRVIETTIAYVGAGESGKTNFAHVSRDVKQGRAGSVEETSVGGGRVLSLAWKPRENTKLNDCELTVKLVSADGLVNASAMQSVLVDADGLVLLLDGDGDDGAEERNQRAVDTVREALARTPTKRVPVVVQINQREGSSDEPSLGALGLDAWPRVNACATKGDGVMETLQRAVDVVVESMQKPMPPEATAPKTLGTTRSEGNPLLAALRQIMQTTMTEQIAVLEARLVERIERQMGARDAAQAVVPAMDASLNERLASVDAWMARIEPAVRKLGEQARAVSEQAALRSDVERIEARVVLSGTAQREDMNERLASVDAWMARIEPAVLQLGERTRAVSERAASREDLERIEARVLEDANTHRDAMSKRLEALEGWLERIEPAVTELGERATAASEQAVSRKAIERLEALVAEGANAHRTAIKAQLAPFEGWMGRVESAIASLGEGARSAREQSVSREDVESIQASFAEGANAQHEATNERLLALETWMDRVESALIGVAERARAAGEKSASREDVERIEARVVADAEAQRDALSKRLAALEAWMDRVEPAVLEVSERVRVATEQTASREDVQRIETRVVADANMHHDTVVSEMREYRKAVREEVPRAVTTATQPLQRVLDALMSEIKKWTARDADLTGALERFGAKSDDVAEQVDALGNDSHAVLARLGDLVTTLNQTDALAGKRIVEIRESLRMFGEQAECRAQAMHNELAALVEELRKKKKSWLG